MTAGIDTDFLVKLTIVDHDDHQRAVKLRDRLLDAGGRLAITPQVTAEFIHVVTDAKRFRSPATMAQALEVASGWWGAREVYPVFPDERAVRLFLDWMVRHRLGRRRLLDTLLAATYAVAGVERLITGNAADYSVFGRFEILSP